jgi:hypothetical protein
MRIRRWARPSLLRRSARRSLFQRCSWGREWKKCRKASRLLRKWRRKAPFVSHGQGFLSAVTLCARCSNKKLCLPKDSTRATNAKAVNLPWKSDLSLAWRDYTKKSTMKDASKCDIQILSAWTTLPAEIQELTDAPPQITLRGRDITHQCALNVALGQRAPSLYSSVMRCTLQSESQGPQTKLASLIKPNYSENYVKANSSPLTISRRTSTFNP